MKNGKAIFLSAAVIFGAAGMIFGNHVAAGGAFAAGSSPEPAIVLSEGAPASAIQLSDVGMYGNSDGGAYLALMNPGSDIQVKEITPTSLEVMPESRHENPTDGNLSEEDAKQIGIKAVSEKYGLTQKDLDNYDVTVRGAYAADWPSTVPDRIVWTINLYPNDAESKTYGATVDDKMERDILVHGTLMSKEGTPSENELSSEKAQELAIAAIAEKYALTQETLNKFTVTIRYYEVTKETPGKHSWWVNLYPANNADFSEIGCYWTYLDAETGNVLQMNSAANGKG